MNRNQPPNGSTPAARSADDKHGEVAILDRAPEARSRWGKRKHWLMVGLAAGATAFAVLKVQTDHPPAQKTSAGRPSNDELASKIKGAYPATTEAPRGERSYSLRAAPSQIEIVPNGSATGVWAYNGQVPGPVLHARVGERVRVSVTNALPEPTTVHWHGVRVTNAMDGVPDLTQARIQPGGSFEYSFVPRDPGTFWYHPHYRTSEQVERGLQGVLIVDDENPAPWSRDVVWVLDDWRLTGTSEVDPNFNGMHDVMMNGRWGNVVTVNGHVSEQLKVRAGERIRLRLVNTANARIFVPDFRPLRATAIAVDGMYAERPFDAAGFELAPGNRIDLDLTIPPELRGQSIAVTDHFLRRPFGLAAIDVGPEPPVVTPAFPTPAHALLPDWSKGLEEKPGITYRVNVHHGMGAMGGGMGGMNIVWTLNGAAYGHDTPTMLTEGEWVKIRYVNGSSSLHPIHIHGMFFRVLARNGSAAMEPYWRDTVLVHPRETVDIALVPIDTGKWMLHCHVLEHAEAGMMTVLEVTPAK
jgi:FtsP/CotA-like multicopper oxidase with cupredoxin domain